MYSIRLPLEKINEFCILACFTKGMWNCLVLYIWIYSLVEVVLLLYSYIKQSQYSLLNMDSWKSSRLISVEILSALWALQWIPRPLASLYFIILISSFPGKNSSTKLVCNSSSWFDLNNGMTFTIFNSLGTTPCNKNKFKTWMRGTINDSKEWQTVSTQHWYS